MVMHNNCGFPRQRGHNRGYDYLHHATYYSKYCFTVRPVQVWRIHWTKQTILVAPPAESHAFPRMMVWWWWACQRLQQMISFIFRKRDERKLNMHVCLVNPVTPQLETIANAIDMHLTMPFRLPQYDILSTDLCVSLYRHAQEGKKWRIKWKPDRFRYCQNWTLDEFVTALPHQREINFAPQSQRYFVTRYYVQRVCRKTSIQDARLVASKLQVIVCLADRTTSCIVESIERESSGRGCWKAHSKLVSRRLLPLGKVLWQQDGCIECGLGSALDGLRVYCR